MIRLPGELEAFVRNELASGRFQTESDVVCAGLRLLQQQTPDPDYDRVQVRNRAELIAALEEGRRAFVEGDFIELADDAAIDLYFDDLMRRGRERLAQNSSSSE